MTAEFRKIGDSIHKILDLEGVVSGGLVLKLYEDLFNENTKPPLTTPSKSNIL